jgi:hypothetical protein
MQGCFNISKSGNNTPHTEPRTKSTIIISAEVEDALTNSIVDDYKDIQQLGYRRNITQYSKDPLSSVHN